MLLSSSLLTSSLLSLSSELLSCSDVDDAAESRQSALRIRDLWDEIELAASSSSLPSSLAVIGAVASLGCLLLARLAAALALAAVPPNWRELESNEAC